MILDLEVALDCKNGLSIYEPTSVDIKIKYPYNIYGLWYLSSTLFGKSKILTPPMGVEDIIKKITCKTPMEVEKVNAKMIKIR